MATLLSNNKLSKAQHNIMAYRIFNETASTFTQVSDTLMQVHSFLQSSHKALA